MLHFTAIFVLFFVKLGFFGSSIGKESTHNVGDLVWFLGQENLLEKG